jgi:hypothetical protein
LISELDLIKNEKAGLDEQVKTGEKALNAEKETMKQQKEKLTTQISRLFELNG